VAADYDVVIIGGGVAGALCAWRLSEKPNPPKVLLLEEGDNGLDDSQRAGCPVLNLSDQGGNDDHYSEYGASGT